MITAEQQERIVAYLLRNIEAALSLQQQLKKEHFGDGNLRFIYGVLCGIIKKSRKAPTEREMVSWTTIASKKKTPLFQAQILEILQNLYKLDVSTATYAEAVEYLVRQELQSIARDIIADEEDDAEKTVTSVRDQMEKLVPFIASNSEEQIINPLSPEWLQKLEVSGPVPESEVVRLGFPMIQQFVRNQGLLRGEISIVMAVTNGGKSMFLIDQFVRLLEQGYKGIYITLDNVQSEILERVYANMTRLSLDEPVDLKRRTKLLQHWMDNHPKFHHSHMMVKALPDRTNIATLRAYISQAERKVGGKLDFVIVDYGDCVTPMVQRREDRNNFAAAFAELRSLAQAHSLALFTATQANRKSFKDLILDLGNMAESYGKAMVASFILVLAPQTGGEQEQTPQRMRAYLVKNTKGANSKEVHFVFEPRFASFTEESVNDTFKSKYYHDITDDNKKTRTARGSETDSGVYRTKPNATKGASNVAKAHQNFNKPVAYEEEDDG